MNTAAHTATPVTLPAGQAPGWALLLMLGGLIAFAPLSIDMYLPGLPDIAREFGVSAGVAQYTLAAYFVGMALGQAVYGPVADRYGRKPPLYFGLALYTVASLGCMIASSIHALIAWRFAQALGGCATVVMPLAMVADRFDQAGSAKVFSRLMLVMGVAPILAPVLGSLVVGQWGWRAIFGLLAVSGFMALLATRFLLSESLPVGTRPAGSLSTALHGYGRLLRQRDFVGFALIGGCAGAGMFAYIAGSSFVFIDLYGLSAQQYGAVFGANALGLIAASQINHALLVRWGGARLMQGAVLAMAVLGLLGVAGSLLAPRFGLVPGQGMLPLLLLLVPVFCFLVTFGFISPNTSAAAMARHGEGGGSASALIGTLQFGLGAAAGAMTSVMAAAGVGVWVCWRYWLTPSARG